MSGDQRNTFKCVQSTHTHTDTNIQCTYTNPHTEIQTVHIHIHPHTHTEREKHTERALVYMHAHTHVHTCTLYMLSDTHTVVEASITEAIGAGDRDTRHSRYKDGGTHNLVSPITINYRTSEAELPAHDSTSHKNYSIFTSSATFVLIAAACFDYSSIFFLNI